MIGYFGHWLSLVLFCGEAREGSQREAKENQKGRVVIIKVLMDTSVNNKTGQIGKTNFEPRCFV